MKHNYFSSAGKAAGIALACFSFLLISSTLRAQSDFPTPDQALLFDDQDTAYHSTMADSSGNDNNAYWYAYREGKDVEYAQYFPDSGMFGGSWFISGYHICCNEMASPSMDFIILAGNNDPTHDVEGFQGINPLYQEGFTSFTVAFWFKSARDYSKETTPCPPEPTGMHEQELLLSFGAGNGVGINNYKGYYEIKISSTPEGGTAVTGDIPYLYAGEGAVSKQWQHIAVTFDGADNGKLTVYIDGELAKTYLGDPNPLETGITELFPSTRSFELGAQNGPGLFGNVGAFWGGVAEQYCITEQDTGMYRTGWPASGYYDDYVFYKNQVLTSDQIVQLKDNGIKALMSGDVKVQSVKAPEYRIYPNPARNSFRINSQKNENIDLRIYDVLGKEVLHRTNERTNSQIDISSLRRGFYIIRVNGLSAGKLMVE